jgi:two-component system sensor histidine kinase/response regulator
MSSQAPTITSETISPPPRKRILIVDDDPRNIRLLRGILFSEPYDLVIAQSGTEALQIIDSHPPDLVLLDIMMPSMNGFEVCKHIKGSPRLRIIPVVIVTALSDVSDRIEAMRAGADDFLNKPVDATELVVRMRSLIRMRQLYTEIERITAQRLQFMAGIAHNLRSPLNALTLSIELLADFVPTKDEQLSPIWQNIKTCLDNIQMLSNDIMNYYQIEAGQLRLQLAEYPLQMLIEEVHRLALPLASRVEFVVGPIPPIALKMDRKIISQILLNLITNAIKYTEAGGRIRLRAYDLSTEKYTLPVNHYPPVLALPSSGVVIEIADTGRGIHPDDFTRVFAEFDRLRASAGRTEGVGLGLPVSQRLVRVHGGELWFASTYGQGSTFAFFLPA